MRGGDERVTFLESPHEFHELVVVEPLRWDDPGAPQSLDSQNLGGVLPGLVVLRYRRTGRTWATAFPTHAVTPSSVYS